MVFSSRARNSWRRSIAATALLVSFTEAQTQLFHHRSSHISIIVGDYLYIDGGEVATWNGSGNGYEDGYGAQDQAPGFCDQAPGSTQEQCIGNITDYPVPDTYSIDLSSSWTNTTAVLKTIPKVGPPVVNEGVVWLDASGQSWYAYDGSTSEATGVVAQPGPNALWQFIPDNSGSGLWTSVAGPSNTNFSQLGRTNSPAYASGEGLGFALGGIQDGQTIEGYGTVYPPGLVIYNTSSQSWLNVSALGYSSDGTSARAAAQFVPSFGPSGLLFVLGGQVGYAATDVSTSSVNFFDPVSQQWKTQAVSGNPPPPSQSSCLVGAPGDNGTYEIFQYGGVGLNIDDSVTLGNVFVLSLPAFNWQNATNTAGAASVARSLHTCNMKNNQMVVVGGSTFTEAGYNYIMAEPQGQQVYWSNADPWSQGLGVFDLSDMVWADSFDSSAAQYATPKVVKDYYLNNPQYPASLLQDATLRDWFKVSNGTNSPSSGSGSSNNSNGSGSSNTGAIAGGVVGGVSAVAAVAIIAWFALRHRRRRGYSQGRTAPLYQDDDPHKVELDTPQRPYPEMPGTAGQWDTTSSPGQWGTASSPGQWGTEGSSSQWGSAPPKEADTNQAHHGHIHEMEGGRLELPG